MAVVTNTLEHSHSASQSDSASQSGRTDGAGETLAVRRSSFGFSGSSGQRRFIAAGAIVFGVLAALSNDDGPVLCPLRRCSGGYCPGCGLTRSGGRLLRGDVAGSWQQHPYLLIAIAQIAAVATLWSVGSASLRQRLATLGRPALAVNAALMAAVWVVRMTNGSIPIPFFS